MPTLSDFLDRTRRQRRTITGSVICGWWCGFGGFPGYCLHPGYGNTPQCKAGRKEDCKINSYTDIY